MSTRHRNRGERSPMSMRWVATNGDLMRASGTVISREAYGLPEITVAAGDIWVTDDQDES